MSRISPVRDPVTIDLSSADYVSTNGFNNIYVGTTGNVTVVTQDGRTVTYPNMAPGTWHACQGKAIIRATTTASGLLVGLS